MIVSKVKIHVFSKILTINMSSLKFTPKLITLEINKEDNLLLP